MIEPSIAAALVTVSALSSAAITWSLARRETGALAALLADSEAERARLDEQRLDARRASERDALALARARAGLEAVTAEHLAARARSARQQRRERDRSDAVRALAAGLSHELTNPLTYLLSNLDFALEVVDDPGWRETPSAAELREVLSDARQGGARLREILKPLRIFARIDPGDFGPVDLDEVIAAALDASGDETPARGVCWTPTHGQPVRGSREQLALVFGYLLRGAARSSPPSGQLRIETARSGDVVTTSITGAGAEPQEGEGLGLLLCDEILRLHGGWIQVTSAPGQATAVSVSLPIQATPSQGLRVMVVDDDARMARLLRRWITGAGYEVECCTDARQALERIVSGERMDLVICDLGMPGMSGMAFYDALREVDRGAAERVRFLTGGPYSVVSARFMEEMSGRCLEKPIREEQILTWVRDALGGAALR